MCQHKSISILNGDFSGKQTNKTNNNNKKKNQQNCQVVRNILI